MTDNHGWLLFPNFFMTMRAAEATVITAVPHPDGDPNRCIWHIRSFMWLPEEYREDFKATPVVVEEPNSYPYFLALQQDYDQMPRQQVGLRNTRLEHLTLVREEISVARSTRSWTAGSAEEIPADEPLFKVDAVVGDHRGLSRVVLDYTLEMKRIVEPREPGFDARSGPARPVRRARRVRRSGHSRTRWPGPSTSPSSPAGPGAHWECSFGASPKQATSCSSSSRNAVTRRPRGHGQLPLRLRVRRPDQRPAPRRLPTDGAPRPFMSDVPQMSQKQSTGSEAVKEKSAMSCAQAVVYDTALRGVHHQQILRHLGLIPINRVAAAKAGAKTPRRDKAERRTEKSTVIEAKTITRPRTRLPHRDGDTTRATLPRGRPRNIRPPRTSAAARSPSDSTATTGRPGS